MNSKIVKISESETEDDEDEDNENSDDVFADEEAVGASNLGRHRIKKERMKK